MLAARWALRPATGRAGLYTTSRAALSRFPDVKIPYGVTPRGAPLASRALIGRAGRPSAGVWNARGAPVLRVAPWCVVVLRRSVE